MVTDHLSEAYSVVPFSFLFVVAADLRQAIAIFRQLQRRQL